jgi:RNA polymerase sigma-70 factor (ECF subfamily)
MTTEPPDDRFITLLLANQSRVFRFLFTLVPRREDVEDLFQQTCLTLWQERAKFDPEEGAFASWACAIAQNHVRNFRRRESTRQALLSEEVAELLLATREAGGRFSEECHQALQHCLNRLPPRQKALLEEGYREGPLNRTAAVAGRSANALYKSLRRIRAILHDCMLRVLGEGSTS